MKACLLILGLFLRAPAQAASESCASGPCAANDRLQAAREATVSDLQNLGIPASVAVYDSPKDKVISVYELSPSSPTALGLLLRQALASLDQRQRAQLQFKLARNDHLRLGKALLMLENITQMQNEGQAEAYPEDVKAFMDYAVELLKPGENEEVPPGAEKEAAAVREVLRGHRDLLAGQRALLESTQKILPYLLGRESSALQAIDDSAAAGAARLGEAIESLEALSGSRRDGHLTARGLLTIVRTLPEERLNEAQWKALASAFPNGDSINRMEILKLWRSGITGKGIRIGVIDNGADEDHPDLQGIQHRANYTQERHLKGPKVGQPDNRGEHGTHVAGTIRDLAPEAEIFVYKSNQRTEEGFGIPKNRRMGPAQRIHAGVEALRCAGKDGCTVVSTSINWGEKGGSTLPDDLSGATKELRRQGAIVIKSAGNSGKGTGSAPSYSPDVLTVGAVTYTNREAGFSAHDTYLLPDGEGKTKVLDKPDVVSYGVDVRSAQFHPSSEYKDPLKDYVRWEGTSMATPTVAASVALIQQRAGQLGRKLTLEEMAQLLNETGASRRGEEDDRAAPKIVLPLAACQKLANGATCAGK